MNSFLLKVNVFCVWFFFLKNMKHAVMNRQLISYGEKDWIVVLVLKLEMYSLHFTYNCEGFYKRRNVEFIGVLLIAQHLGAVRNEASFLRCLSPCNYNMVTVVTSVTSETTLLLTLLDLHAKVLVTGGCSCGLCEQNPALPHAQPEPAPAAPTGIHHWAELSHEQCWVCSGRTDLGKGQILHNSSQFISAK